jgi:hypothetical protein
MLKKQSKKLSKLLMALSFMAVLFSGVGYFGFDLWLASTQWLLVSAVIAMFGVYLKLD